MTTRRAFLRWSLGTALVYGLSDLLHADEAPADDAYAQALAHMQRTGSYGVAIAIPAEPDARAALGALIEQLAPQPARTEIGYTDTQRLFLSAVFVCAPRERLPAAPGETIVLLDAAGARLDGANVDCSVAAALVPALERLLHGNGRLEARADAVAAGPLKLLLLDLAREKAPEPDATWYGVNEEVRNILLAAWPHPAPYVERAHRAATATRRCYDAFLERRAIHDAVDLAKPHAPPSADALDRALAHMKETGAHGLALVVPDGFPVKFHASIARLGAAGSSPAALAARLVVFFRVRGTEAELVRLGGNREATLHLLAPDGSHLADRGVSEWDGSLEQEIVEILSALPTRELTEDDRRAASEIEGGRDPEHFVRAWPLAGPVVGTLRAAFPRDIRGEALFGIGRAAFGRSRPAPTQLPYGVRWQYDPAEPYESSPCPACGMASAPLETRRFLEFYVR